ncbi:MAG: hypothetical protein IPM23_18670 [Candidatus Melainabacteria bacterium]|nr:hypothetical protein [Candidatus Melainabacteria bacterium]
MTSTSRPADKALVPHPNPMDRNRSILWARFLIDSDDWLILATKVTRHEGPQNDGDSEFELVSLALVDGAGKTVLEALMKPDHEVESELIARHGLDYSVVFNARPYPAIRETLIGMTEGRELTAWDFEKQRQVLADLDRAFGLPVHQWLGNSVSHQVARFAGSLSGAQVKDGYNLQPLTVNGLGALDECRAVRKTVVDMASSSQEVDPLVSGKPGWTAQFYRPKLGAADRLKNLFGRK